MTTGTLELRSSPHLASGHSVEAIMWNVVLALLPAVAFAVWAFGAAALLTLATALLACTATERLLGRGGTLSDGSAVITGLLFGLTLPPALPLWMTAVGGVVGVAMGKTLFGGLGANPFNPALVGRAFLQAAFPVSMTTWMAPLAEGRFAALPASNLTVPFARPDYDGVSAATPLARMKFDGELTALGDLAWGGVAGSTGETSALLLLAGGAWLVARRMMSWRIPAGVFGAVAVISGLLHIADPSRPPPGFMLLSGGLMLGALFMATDMVASPITSRGAWIYGALIGALVVVIRVFGGMPEGVMYAILLGNAVSPHIDQWVRPKPFGEART